MPRIPTRRRTRGDGHRAFPWGYGNYSWIQTDGAAWAIKENSGGDSLPGLTAGLGGYEELVGQVTRKPDNI